MSTQDRPTLSVVIPAYNEEAAIEGAVEEVGTEVFRVVADAELIVVNDGSRDSTGERLDRLAEKEARLHVIHQGNGGHGGALRAGMDAARGEWLFLIDSDRQIPLSVFEPMWREVQDKDAAFGVRRRRNDPRLRLMLTSAIRGALRLMFRTRLYDANVPFKIVRRSLWEEARPLIPADTLAPSLFLALYLRTRGCRIVEVDVPHRERSVGTVSIRRYKLLKFCAKALGQLVWFRRALRRQVLLDGRAVVLQPAVPVHKDD
jgi:glycosyltransferase involved in cell wall biosynthesis